MAAGESPSRDPVAAGLVDLDERIIIDMVEGNSAADLRRWLERQPPAWHEHHRTGASNGPAEGLNLCVKKVKRCGHGFRTFEHYRLRVLLHGGGLTWPTRPSPPRIRTRAPYSNA